jgi:hypothetical protein
MSTLIYIDADRPFEIEVELTHPYRTELDWTYMVLAIDPLGKTCGVVQSDDNANQEGCVVLSIGRPQPGVDTGANTEVICMCQNSRGQDRNGISVARPYRKPGRQFLRWRRQ